MDSKPIRPNTNNYEMMYYSQLHGEKYRDKDQTFEEHARQMAKSMSSDSKHREVLEDVFLNQRFLPAGRVQAAMGATEREVSAFNCSVSETIQDDMNSIMHAVSQAAKILRLGTGIGYNFSNLRPKGALIKKLQTESSGPVSFMKIYDAMASTIASSGHRRGAQMAILNDSHPDIEEFIDAKMTPGAYRQFNFSVGISDAFMEALKNDQNWDLVFDGKVYKTVKASYLWDKIMRNAYDSAEPGVLFLDRMNKYNNLHYCETIEATNPCSEQPLPAHGLCLLGSFNLPKYVKTDSQNTRYFDFAAFEADIFIVVEALDNIFEKSVYAIPEHKEEALSKRRIGVGLTGIASAIEFLLGKPCYGDTDFNDQFNTIAAFLLEYCYLASNELAKTRGAFPKFTQEYMNSKFIKTLPEYLQDKISRHGIRNSHLISYAPCGTISQVAGNVSSGVEPVFFHEMSRDVHMKHGKQNVTLMDYNYREHGLKGRTLDECTIEQHLSVLEISQRYNDSSVSKTINVPMSFTFEDYKQIYVDAYYKGSKGVTVFRPTPLRGAVITSANKDVKKDNVVPITAKPAQPVPVYNYGQSGSCKDGVCEM